MLVRSRSARFAALALAVTTPLVASQAAPAFADGDDADVSATVTDGNVHISSSKGLSRTTILFCEGEPLVIPSWQGDPHEADIEVEGVVRVVIIHSGNNTTDEAQAILADLAPEVLAGNSTGELAFPEKAEDVGKVCEDSSDDGDNDGDDGDDDGDNDGDDDGDGGNNGGGNNTGESNNGGGNNTGDNGNAQPTDAANNPPPAVTVLGETFVSTDDPAATPAVAGNNTGVAGNNTGVAGNNTGVAGNNTGVAGNNTGVAGNNTGVAGAELPRTGSAHVQFVLSLALSLLATGVMLRAIFGRRVRPASSPG